MGKLFYGSSMAKLRQVRNFTIVGCMAFVLFWIQPGFGNILDSKKYSRIIWNYLETLCAFGPRNPGSEGYRETLNLIRKVGEKYTKICVSEDSFSLSRK